MFAATLPATATDDEDAAYVPVGLSGFEAWGGAAREAWSHAVLTSTDHGDLFEGNIRLLDAAGRQIGLISGFRLQRAARAGRAAGDDPATWLYDISWVEQAIEPGAPRQDRARWLILADRTGVGEKLAGELGEQGAECLLAYAGANSRPEHPDDRIVDPALPDEMRRLVGETLAGTLPVRGVVHLWSLDATATGTAPVEALERDQVVGVGSALHVAQALAAAGSPTSGGAGRPRLWLVTRGAQAVGECAPGGVPAAGGVVGVRQELRGGARGGLGGPRRPRPRRLAPLVRRRPRHLPAECGRRGSGVDARGAILRAPTHPPARDVAT